MNKVSEGRLSLMIESTDLAIAEGQFGVVLCADDVADALAELLDRRAAEREQAAPRADHDVDRFYLENTDYRIEDIVALDDTGYNWNLIHGIGLCGTTRTPFEGWRCILSAGGLSMAGYEGTTMREAISAALSALDQGREAEAQPAPEANTKPLGWVDRLLADWEQGYENAVDGSVFKTNAAWYINRLREAYGEQAAPEPRKPAKWERRLARMGAYLHYTGTKWEVWLSGDSDLFKTVYDGATIRAAVEAAWEAWRREEI